MKHKTSKLIILSALLLFVITLVASAQPPSFAANSKSETEFSPISINLSEQQKNEIERMIDDRIERSATVSDRIQNTVNENFSLLFAISGLTVSALGAIPIFSGAVIFIFRRTILEGIERTITKELLKTGMQEILEEEVKEQLRDQVGEELSRKVTQRLIELEHQADSDLTAFRNQLTQLLEEIEEDKRKYLENLKSLDLNILRDAAAKAARDVVEEFLRKKRPPFHFPPKR